MGSAAAGRDDESNGWGGFLVGYMYFVLYIQ